MKSGTKEWNKYHREMRAKRNEAKVLESRNKKRNVVFPSGVDYQKPFVELRNGYGYEGVLLADKDTGEVQCHECGAWFHWLANHIIAAHKLDGDSYREKYGLGWRTALASDKVREELKKRAATFPWERMHKKGQMLKKMSKEGKTHTRKWWLRNRGTKEEQNKKGTCDLQVLDRMMELSKELGRQPYVHEMISRRGTNMRKVATDRFGSLAELRLILERQGYHYVSSHTRKRYSDKELLGALKDFAVVNKRRPFTSDIQANSFPFGISVYERRFGGIREAIKLAYAAT